MIEKKKGDEIIQYDIKTAIIRIFFLIFISISLYYLYNYYLSGDFEKVDSLIIAEDEVEIISIFKGNFETLDSNVLFGGKGEIFSKSDIRYFLVSDVNTDFNNYTLYFSIDSLGSEELFKFGEFEFNFSETEYLFEIPNEINTSLYRYIVVKNFETMENYGYLDLN